MICWPDIVSYSSALLLFLKLSAYYISDIRSGAHLMRHLKEYLSHTFHSTIPGIAEKIKNMNQETGIKLLQYLMLCVLLYLCFLLPREGAEKMAQESTGRQEIMEDTTTEVETMIENVVGESSAGKSGTAGENGTGQTGVIVIDCGHGGDDPGMIGSSGINEKVLNLVYGKKLKELLEAQGYQVVMTRETEDGLYDAQKSNKKAQDMQRRVAIITESKPLLAVSIHQNSYPDASVAGPQVFYYEHSTEGEKLAKAIQDAMNTELNIARPRVQKGNTSYYILKRSEAVTVIVECGFLSNPAEEAKLQEEDYQDMVAKAVCDGILDYLGQQG